MLRRLILIYLISNFIHIPSAKCYDVAKYKYFDFVLLLINAYTLRVAFLFHRDTRRVQFIIVNWTR